MIILECDLIIRLQARIEDDLLLRVLYSCCVLTMQGRRKAVWKLQSAHCPRRKEGVRLFWLNFNTKGWKVLLAMA